MEIALTPQAAEALIDRKPQTSFVPGHDFTEKLLRALYRGFIIPGIKLIKSTWASAPEARFSLFSLKIMQTIDIHWSSTEGAGAFKAPEQRLAIEAALAAGLSFGTGGGTGPGAIGSEV